MAGTSGNDVDTVELLDAGIAHRQYLAALEKAPAAIRVLNDVISLVGAEIITLTGGAAVNASGVQWEKLRVRYLILSSVTLATRVLTIGTRTFSFDLPASLPVVVPFPLVIERGSDLSFSGDGRCYMIGDPE
jgi:hypothetical protein